MQFYDALRSLMTNYALYTTLKVALGLLLSVFIYIWAAYNAFIRDINQVKNDFSDILIELKRRASLIDQLAVMVKEYSKHEKTTFENVTKARSSIQDSKTIQQTAQAENMITDALKSLFAVVENYPKLQASENYKSLMQSLEDTENRIAKYREEYNRTVRRYNNRVLTFPSLLVARLFGFEEEAFYSIEAEAPTKKASNTKKSKK